ncbi:MAG TPA: PAS domain-containing protein, partial [Solirubrobacteraceae bacterium]|nr:PAS domain-containing protein [Solirubrobacteraceae bacterium]
MIVGGGNGHDLSRAFCAHCGRAPTRRVTRGGSPRLCERCSVGAILEAEPAAAPDGEPFIIVDSSLRIAAVSERAEDLFSVYEHDARGRPVTDFVLRGDRHDRDAVNFVVAIADCFSSSKVHMAPGRLRHRPNLPVMLRIGACTSPRAALVVFAEVGDAAPPVGLAN